MAIGVDGQFHLSFALGSEKDFIALEDLKEFTEISEAGNVMPTFELVFSTTNEKIFGLLHEGNTIQMTFGQTYSDSRDYSFSVTKSKARITEGKAFFHCVGILSKMEYISNTKRRILGPLSGLEVVQQIVEENKFIFDSNLTKSEDSQRWIQANHSDRKFVSDCITHSYLKSSFIVCGISSDGRFIVRDLRKLAKETKPIWTFTQSKSSQTSQTEIVYDPDPEYETNTGFINYWLGYGQERTVFSLENEDLRSISEDVTPVLALTDQVARKASMEKRHQSTALQNENVHPNYWLSALQNITNAAMFDSLKITLTFQSVFKDVKVLDLVNFFDNSIESATAGSSLAQSGLYIVSKVARVVKNKQLVTTVVICRESVNEVSGAIKQSIPAPVFENQFGVSGTVSKPVE